MAAGNSGLKGVLDPGGAVATDPNTVTFTLVSAQRQLPVPRLDLQRADRHHAGRLRRRDDRRRAPDRHRSVEARQLQPADRRDLRAQPGLVGRPDPARQHRVHLLRRDRADDHRLPGRPGRRDRPVRRPDGRRAVQRPELHAHRHAGGAPSADLDAGRQAALRQRQGPRGARAHVGPRRAHPAAVPGARRARQRPRHLAGLSVLRLVDPSARRGISTRPRRCSQKPVPPTCRSSSTPASCRRSRTWPCY